MKHLSRDKIAGFIDKLLGTDEPSTSDRAWGAVNAGATGLIASDLVGSELNRRASQPSDVMDALLDRSKPVPEHDLGRRAAKSLDLPEMPAFVNDAFEAYDPKNHRVHTVPGANPAFVLHEVGHAADRNNPMVKVFDQLRLYKNAPLLGMATGMGMGASGNEDLETWAPAAAATMHAPQLIEETRAWQHGNSALQKLTDSIEAHKSFRGTGRAALGGYAASAGGSALAGYLTPKVIDAIHGSE